MDVKEPPFHYLLVPVVQISKGNFEIRPIEQGLAALKVERSEHPILFSQITQLRRVKPGQPAPDVGYMGGDLGPGGQSRVTLSFLSAKPLRPTLPKGLMYMTDNKDTSYIVRVIDNRMGRDQWRDGKRLGPVVHLFMHRDTATTTTTTMPKLPLSKPNPEPEPEAEEEEDEQEEAPVLEDEAVANLPTRADLELEGIDIFAKLQPVAPIMAGNESEAATQLCNYLIGEMTVMALDVDKTDRINWALFTLLHHLRVRLDKDLGMQETSENRRRWGKRFEMFRRLYEENAAKLLLSQGMYGPHDIPAFADSVHDALHPTDLLDRVNGVFSPNARTHRRTVSAAGVNTAEDELDLIIAAYLHFCRRQIYRVAFFYNPETNQFNEDFEDFLWAMHEQDTDHAKEELSRQLREYEMRLAHPRPRGFDAYHPLLFSKDELAEFDQMDVDHQTAVLEEEHSYVEEERDGLAALQRERQRAVQKDKEEREEETPRQRKLPGATPKGSPTEVDARIYHGLQRMMSRIMATDPVKAEKIPTLSEVVAEMGEWPDLKPRAPLPSLSFIKAYLRANWDALTPADKNVLAAKASQRVASSLCAQCKTPGAKGRCPACKTAYCNESCQEAHWHAGHKMMCGGGM